MRKTFFVAIWAMSLILVGLSVFTLTHATNSDAVLVTGGDVRITNGRLIVGNSENFTEIDLNGIITLNGLACIQREIVVPAITVEGGVNPPSEKTADIGESGDVKVSVLEFDQGDTEPVYVIFPTLPDLDNSHNVTFSILWMPEQDYTSGTYTWQLEYLIKNQTGVNANYTSGTPTTITEDVTPTSADFFIETKFTSTINLNQGQELIGTFLRTDNDADTGGFVRFFKLEYTANVLG